MKISIVSDIHTECFFDEGVFKKLEERSKEIDALIVAGDLSNGKHLGPSLKRLVDNFENVVYVTGNHEYWHTTIEKLEETICNFASKHTNLHYLNNSSATIKGQRFLGTTLWFPDTLKARLNKTGYTEDFFGRKKYTWSDFENIKGFDNWIWGKFEEQSNFIKDNVKKEDIVVTHYLPFPESIHQKYLNDSCNCFFLSDLTDKLRKIKSLPKLFIHGHTHESFDYMIEDSRIICNPVGYIGEKRGFQPKIIDI